jgi:tetraacyldisaccharide 4'-kinase
MGEELRNMHTKRYAAWPRRCIAVSGIAHPAQFEAGLSRNCQVVRHFAYPDHHSFTREEMQEWTAAATEGDFPAEAIITTEKDASRIRALQGTPEVPVLVLGMQVKWWDEDALQQLLTSISARVDASTVDPDI